MVRIDYLDPFDTYRTRPPVIMPETKSNRKKSQIYMVIAPTIEAEMSYLATEPTLTYRNLYKYFIEKRWDYSFRGQGRRIVKLNETGDITAMLTKYKKGNLKKIDGVTSYLPASKARPMKDLNVLVELNYVTELLLANEKDRRLMSVKAKDILAEYIRIIDNSKAGGYLGNYTSVNIVIPMHLWFNKEDYRNPQALMKPAAKNFMGQFLNLISDPKVLEKLGRVYLIHGNIVCPLDATKIPENAKEDYVNDTIRRFMMKARTQAKDLQYVETDDAGNVVAVDPSVPEDVPDAPEIEDTETEVIQREEKLKAAEKQTITDISTDKVLTKSKIDPDKVPEETRKKVEQAVEKEITPKVVAKSEVEAKPDTMIIDDAIEETKINDPADVDVLLAAKMQNKSVQSVKRDEVLKQKYKEIKFGDVHLTQLINDEKNYAIPETPVAAKTINEDMKKIKSFEFEKAYNENLAAKDLVNILLHFSHASPAMYLNKDIKIEDVSTPTDRMIRYTVEFEDETRKRHRFPFLLPKMYKERYLYLSGQELNITHQKLPFPINKISPDMCQAVSNYKKVTVSRYGGNVSPRITKLKKLFTSPGCPRIIQVDTGDAVAMNREFLTTIEYDELSSEVIRLTMGNANDRLIIYFNMTDAKVVVPNPEYNKWEEIHEDSGYIYPLGYLNKAKVKTYYYISGKTNKVYDQKGTSYGELSDFIIDNMIKYDPTLEETFKDITAGSKFVYTRAKIMGEFIPLILVLGAADPGGLLAVLEKAKIEYSFSEKRPSGLDKDKYGVIAFADGYLTYARYPYENSLLMNGLNTFPTKEFNFLDMGTRDAYVEIFDIIVGRRTLIDAMQNFYYMFVDPITADVLIRLELPTDFTRLLLYCNDTLADNTFRIDSDYNNSRLRSNEVIYAYLYRELAEAWGYYRSGKADKFSIPENIVIKDLMTSYIVDPHSVLNLTLEAENDRQVKLKGPSGMNEEHSYTIEKRAYHPSMVGIVGMNSTPSGEVGINRHMSLNSNIVDARGFIEVGRDRDSYDGSEIATPGELMQTFGPESADIERVAMAISQSKHVVPVAKSTPSLVTYDMERVIPYISNDFAVTAKDNGRVVAIENEIMIIQYDNGKYEDIDLAERPANNTDGGFYIINQLKTDLKVGSKVKKGQIVATDPKYIQTGNDMFGDPVANFGTLARVSLETNGDVYEDSCYITDKLAHEMATKITKQKRVILSKYANIKYMVKVGDYIKANDPLLTFDDTQDEFTSQLLASMAEEAGDEDEVIASNAPVISKLTGTIRDIQIFYTVDPKETTPSMQKLLNSYIKDAQKREKTISKYKDIRDANTITKTAEKLVPDSTGKVKGVKVQDNIIIDFYIEYDDTMAVGDKQSYFSALKGVVGNLIPTEYAAYTESNPDKPIDACLSAYGMYKRMCLDVAKVGMLTKVLVERKRMLKETYGQRVKNELKK